MGDLSSAVQILVAVARAFADTDAEVGAADGGTSLGTPTLMVLDEPTAALPTARSRSCSPASGASWPTAMRWCW